MSEPQRLGPALAVFFRHASNLALAASVVAIAAWLAWQGPRPSLLLWTAIGVLMFPFYEYVFHRFLLHAPPIRALSWLQARVHGDHHLDTRRIDRFFTPLWTLPLLVAFQLGLYTALGLGREPALALLLGNLAGFLYYEWVHYVAHVAYMPRSAWGRRMKAYHLRHHHKHERYWFGVTTPWIDRLFGTDPPVESVPRSDTARRLHDA